MPGTASGVGNTGNTALNKNPTGMELHFNN